MKLITEQIDQLYAFTRQHDVEYYDLQNELVDHLANAIEQQWEENPAISFEDALQIEFKKFGIFGFNDLVEERKKALIKRYNKLKWLHFKEFFKLPKIVITIGAVFLVYQILKILFQENYHFSKEIRFLKGLVLIGFIVLAIIDYIKNVRRKRRELEKGERRWLLKELIFSSGTSWTAFIWPLWMTYTLPNLLLVYGVPSEVLYSSISLFIISVFYVSSALYMFVAIKVIPKKAEQYLKQTYPEYEFSK